MNKNLLIKQNNELFNRINVLKSNNSALNLKVTRLTAEVEGYKQKIASLENELQLLRQENISVDSEVLPLENIEFETPAENIVVKESASEEIELPDEFLFASDVIGNIVIKAASAIEKLNNSPNENTKELINLILGKTELAKAEILNIISSEVSYDSKQELINNQFNDAIDYIKSILEQ